MKITFIQTGGTIDKDYPKTTKGYAFEIADAAVKRILEKVKVNFEYEIEEAFKKDSLDITDEDRRLLKDICKKVNNDKIIITHGTDTMIETALYLAKESDDEIKDKTIILVGAALPERFYNSDATFNVGVAVGAINVLAKGVYIAMNGRIYPYNKVKRDLESGIFIEK